MSSETENSQNTEEETTPNSVLKRLTSSFAARLIFTLVVAISALTAEKITGISSEKKEEVEVAHVENNTSSELKDISKRVDDITNDFKRLDSQTMTVKDGLKIQYQMYRLHDDIESLKIHQAELEARFGAKPSAIHKPVDVLKTKREPTLTFSEYELQMLNGTLSDENIH